MAERSVPVMKNYKRVDRKFTMHVSAMPDKVFPLLCPVREYEWIETWHCEMVHSISGFAELDYVFKTRHDEIEDIWEVCKYQPNELIEFVVNSVYRVMRYRFALSPDGRGNTMIEIEQMATAVSKEGEDHVDEPHFDLHMKTLEIMLNHYLTTGTMMKNEEVSRELHSATSLS
jgi:hypothetical protein